MSSTDKSYVDAVATDIVVAATEINNNADSINTSRRGKTEVRSKTP
jgi:hypothetical protein